MKAKTEDTKDDEKLTSGRETQLCVLSLNLSCIQLRENYSSVSNQMCIYCGS